MKCTLLNPKDQDARHIHRRIYDGSETKCRPLYRLCITVAEHCVISGQVPRPLQKCFSSFLDIWICTNEGRRRNSRPRVPALRHPGVGEFPLFFESLSLSSFAHVTSFSFFWKSIKASLENERRVGFSSYIKNHRYRFNYYGSNLVDGHAVLILCMLLGPQPRNFHSLCKLPKQATFFKFCGSFRPVSIPIIF